MPKRRTKQRRAAAPAKRKSRGRGGARIGAGRKRDKLPDDVIARLGNPPEDAAELDGWTRKLLAELLVLQLSGKVSVDLAASIRASCGEIRRGLPTRPTAAPDEEDDDDLDEDDGPDLEDADDDALRIE